MPENSIVDDFFLFLPASRQPFGPHLYFHWQYCYHWVLLRWYLWKESYSRLLPSQFFHYLPENSIFSDFFLFLPAYEQPLNPSSAFIDKMLNWVLLQYLLREETHPIILPFSWKFIFKLFLAICPHLCLLMSTPLTPPLLLLTKMLSLGDLAMIFMERKLFQLFLAIFPSICQKTQFLALFPYLRLLMHDRLTPPPLLLNKILSLGDLAVISMERKSAKAISDSLYLLPNAIISRKVKNWLFPRLCSPMGYPMAFFSFFLTGCVG